LAAENHGPFRKCYGVTTVSERGQIVVPAEARRELELAPGTKLLVFAPTGGHGLVLMKAETVTHFIRQAVSHLSGFEDMLKAEE
jgi:AbrB family looped-hinge helix DNA binding protein